MSFTWPVLLASLLLIPLGLVALRRIEAGRRRRLEALAGMGVATPRTAGRWRDRIPDALVLAACALFCIALARPQLTVSVPRPQGSVILAFDVSGSMAAEDVEPSRLEAAKAIGHAFADARPDGVLLGVVAFSDGALTVQVPTDAAGVVEAAIDRLLPAQGTSVGEGLAGAIEALSTPGTDAQAGWYSNASLAPEDDAAAAVAPGSDDSAEIVLLTDGENTAAPAPAAVAQLAAARGLRVHTIGMGTADGADLTLGGFSVHTALDAPALEQVARTTAGSYHAAADAPAAIALVYSRLGRRIQGHPEALELTAAIAGLGLALLGVGALLSLWWRGRLP
ncbi:MAG: VWA domain-containing protein [Chloroflexota bacterium]